MIEYITIGAIFILGCCVGSFLNVCIYRIPKEQSVIRPRSFCPNCRKQISVYDNIPLLSFLLLGGRCRNCKEPIPIRYFLVEALTGIAVLLLYFRFGISSAESIFFLSGFFVFFALMIVVSFIDIDYHAIPVFLCVLGITVGLIFSFINSVAQFNSGNFNLSDLSILRSLKGLFFGLGFTYAFKLFGDIFISVYLRLRKKESIEGETESMGLGDVDFMGMVGVFLGWQTALFSFLLAPFIAVLYAIIALIFKRSHLIPYLPYLSLATFIVFFWGKEVRALINLLTGFSL